MRVLVTGANGFIGRRVVEALVARGHEVRALHRSDQAARFPAHVELVRVDLRSAEGMPEALEGIDVVVHAAALTRGSRAEQYEGTVSTTENLLAAMNAAAVRRIVLVSSFAVYLGRSADPGDQLDERSPIATPATARDPYSEMKLRQESLVRGAASSSGWAATLARPGFVFGAGNLWTNRLGYRIGDKLWLCVGGGAMLPLTYVQNCAEALALIAEKTVSGVRVINIVDDDLPTQAEYRRELIARIGRPKVLAVLPWPVVHVSLRLFDVLCQLTGQRLQLPAILRVEAGRARWQPIRYGNRALRALGWSPSISVCDGLDAATST